MIAVIVSATTEWNAVKSRCSIENIEWTPFGEAFVLTQNGEQVTFFHGGWGKVNAAASTQYIIDTHSPELVLNLGTCGGFAGEVSVGDIILAEKTLVYDIYERMGDPDAAIRAYATGLDVSWIDDAPDASLTRSLLVSADRDLDPDEVASLREKYQAIAGDWESGAIAHVCKRNRVKVCILRGVSDIVGPDGGEAYQSSAVFVAGTEMIMDKLLRALPTWVTMYRASAT